MSKPCAQVEVAHAQFIHNLFHVHTVSFNMTSVSVIVVATERRGTEHRVNTIGRIH
jgi:hypothetical protein